jgi:hypothetical protein
MKRIGLLLSAFFAIMLTGTTSWSDNRIYSIYGVYSETFPGMKFDVNNPGDSDGAKMGVWPDGVTGLASSANAAEGNACLKVNTGPGGGGIFMQFGCPWGNLVATDMSAYADGYLNFWIKTDSAMKVKIVWKSGSQTPGAELPINVAAYNTWQFVSIKLSNFSGADFTNIVQPAIFFPVNTSYTHEFYIDNVFWSKATDGSGKYSATLKNVSGSGTPTEITWSSINPGITGWQRADQYIELALDSYFSGWGIQIYTDNTASNAVPQYTGTGAAAGLVDTHDTTQSLPMCWRIVDVSTGTTGIVLGTSPTTHDTHLYEKMLGGAKSDYPCFFWMKDKNDSDFELGDDYITVWSNKGIHHAEGPNWGGSVSPNLIYFGANFANAMGLGNYKTGKLVIELFNE